MRKKVLIGDSDFYFSGSLTWHLSKEGFDISEARTGEEVIKKLRTEKPDVVLLNLHISGKDGFEVLEEKYVDESIRKIPVVMISDDTDPKSIERALELGANDFSVKSNINQMELVEKIRQQLELDTVKEIFDTDVHATPGTLEGKTVMWVEDEPSLSDSIAQAFSKEKCTLLQASNSEAALEIMKVTIPDVIVLDVLLKNSSGFDIAEKMKTDPRLGPVPIMFVTNYGQKEYRDRAMALGATAFIEKLSMTLEELIGEVKKIVNAKQL